MDDPDEDRLNHLARASSLALAATDYADVPDDVVAELRSVCLGLPETVEKQAWAGTQWRIRNRMFAHVLSIDFPDGPVTVLTFRSSGPELDALRGAGQPFFRPAWGSGLVGMVLDAAANFDEVMELVIESYCALAPAKLVALVDRPTA
ncbi:MAG TPA: MmcQ/YjbR family DNA-binding protein [Acidimicrobiales bacterium]|nr:MmcQ/YjbR family DNA-binding protein [Acidimicrobiales bacterium]